MKKIKEFIKENKEIVITSIIGAGLATVGIVAYQMGFKRGVEDGALKGTLAWTAMINADLDGTAMLVEDCLTDIPEDEMKNFITFGNEMLRSCNEDLKGLA